jgi:hypothetical protein
MQPTAARAIMSAAEQEIEGLNGATASSRSDINPTSVRNLQERFGLGGSGNVNVLCRPWHGE